MVHEVKRIDWVLIDNNTNVYDAYNEDGEHLGFLQWESVGKHMHWCWYQFTGIRLTPGCSQEMRDKQVELYHKKRDK